MRFHPVICLGLSLLVHSLCLAEEKAAAQTFPVKANQGVAVDAKHFYAISNTKITQHEKETGNQIAVWEADRKRDSQKHFTHMNSATVIDGKLYAAHSRFPVAPNENTVEIFSIGEKSLTHETTISMTGDHGSLTWIDQRGDSTWWMCYAVYGKNENRKTRLVKYRFEDRTFTELQNWLFPEETVAKWETMSCSGGSWGTDGLLYVTGHDSAEVHVLQIDANQVLRHLRTQPVPGISGQATAWDRSSEKPTLWGIVKNKHVSLNMFPPAN